MTHVQTEGSRRERLVALGCLWAAVGVWMCGWAIGTLWLDYRCARILWVQNRAIFYPTVVGEITKSRVISNDVDSGLEADIHYQYRVEDRPFTGNAVRFAGGSGEPPRQTVKGFNVGEPVPVYFVPKHPHQSALMVGLSPWDLWLTLMALPFNVILIVAIGMLTRPLRTAAHPNTISRIDSAGHVRFRIRGPSRLLGASIFAVVLGGFCTVAFPFAHGLLPNWPLIIFLWLVVLVPTLGLLLSRTVTLVEFNSNLARLTLRTGRSEISICLTDLGRFYVDSIDGRIRYAAIEHTADGKRSTQFVTCADTNAARWLVARLTELCDGLRN